MNLIFNDPRLRMTVGGRLLVRVISWITYLVLIAAIFTLLISSVVRFRFVGVLLGLMLADFLIHRSEGDMPIPELPKVGEVNVARAMRPVAYTVLERVFDASVIAQQNFFLEVLERALEFPETEEALKRLDVSIKEFRDKLGELMAEKLATPLTRAEYLKQAEALSVRAFEVAAANSHAFIEIGDLITALFDVGDNPTDRLLNLFSIEAGDIERAMIFGVGTAGSRARGLGRIPQMLGGFVLDSHRRVQHRIMNRAWTSRPTPALDACGTDLTDLARDGEIGFLVGHEEEYTQLVETLGRPVNPNALLVGEAGIGKEAIIQHLAFRLTKDDVPRTLFDKRLVSLDLQGLVAGATPDILNARIKAIIEEIYMAGNIILYIPDIHNLVKTSGTAYLSAADALMPVIMNNSFPVVGATYPKEFKQSIEARSDFAGAFEVIRVNEITEADAEKILSYEGLILEREYKVTISFGAIKRAVSLAKRYIRGKFLPSSAEELLKSTVVEAERRGEKSVGPDLVTRVTEAKVHIPIHQASGAEADQLLHMEAFIHERFVDQEEAVAGVATALREYRSGLARKGGPIASFLFVGPTGVGKTELAKILADIQFGSEKMMARFDMTEYQDKSSFVRFIGSPDGTVRGALTEAVLEKPFSLVLLDEFEKAYPDILNLFLQVLDDGRLTDGLGRTVDFTNTIVIATSNAHSDICNDALAKGQPMSEIAEYLKTRLVDVFKPELINRFSKVIIFKNLEPKELGQVVVLNLNELIVSLREQGISLECDPTAVSELARVGYDPAFGARPLRRAIEDKVRAPLAEAILAKRVVKGGNVKLVFKEGKFEFE